MQSHGKPAGRSRHLRSGLFFLALWACVVILGVNELQGGDWPEQLPSLISRPMYLLVLLAASVVLLAFVLRSFALYFKAGLNAGDRNR